MSGFSTKESYDSAPIGEGWHPVRITKVEYIPESGSYKPAAQIRWHILGGDDQGRTFRQRLVLIPAPFGYGVLAQICKSMGVEGVSDDPDNGLDPHSQVSLMKCLVGKPVMVRTKNEKWESNGKSGVNQIPQEFRSLRKQELTKLETLYEGELPPLPEDWNQDRDGNPLVGGTQGEAFTDEFDDGFSDDDIPF